MFLTLSVSTGSPSIQLNNQTATIAVVLAGSQGLTESGNGILTLAAANTFSGVTSISSGTLRIAAASALQNSTVSVDVDGGLTFSGAISAFTFGGLSGSHGFALTDATNGEVTLQVGGDNASTSFSGSIVGNGALTKVGTGSLTLSGTNSYIGGTVVQKGALIFSANTAIPNAGTPSITVQSGATVAAGSPIDQTFVNSLTSNSAGIIALAADLPRANLDFSSAGANLPNISLGAFGGSWTYGGTLTPNGSVYRLGGGGGTLTVNSQLSGPNSITMPSSAGTVVLSNPSNNFTGGITINIRRNA